MENKSKTARQIPFVSYVVRNSGILIGLMVLVMIFSVCTDSFLTDSNIINVFRQISINAILAFGMTFVILLGGIDLSVGSVVGMCGCFGVTLVVLFGAPLWLAILAALALGGLFGLVTGVIVAKGKLPPFIVTLAMMTIGRGVAYIFTDGKPTRYDDEAFSMIGNGYVGIIPIPVVIMAVLLLACALLLGKTKFGRHIYGVGGNREAAKFSGINVARVEIIVYMLCGLLAAVSGVITASRLTGAQPTAGNGGELDAIAAAVLGGTSMTGGVGRVGGTIIGALIIGVLNNGLNLMQVSYYWQLVVKGLIILLAVYIDRLKKDRVFDRLLRRKPAH